MSVTQLLRPIKFSREWAEQEYNNAVKQCEMAGALPINRHNAQVWKNAMNRRYDALEILMMAV